MKEKEKEAKKFMRELLKNAKGKISIREFAEIGRRLENEEINQEEAKKLFESKMK